MRGRTWLPAKPKPLPKPKVADDARKAIDAQAAPVVAMMKKRFCKEPKNPQFNWPDNFFSRWHRGALYFVVVMRTPRGRPPTFEVHAARMEYVVDGQFNLAVPMRRGWNTCKKNVTPEECLQEIRESISFWMLPVMPNPFQQDWRGNTFSEHCPASMLESIIPFGNGLQ